MKRLWIIFHLLGSFASAFALNPIDSLTQHLQNHPARDSIRVNLLNQLGYSYWITNPLQSEMYGNEAIALADSLNYLNGRAFARRVVGVSHWARGHYATALTYLFDGLADYQKLNDNGGIGSIFNNIGLVYQDQRSYELALQYFEHALEKYRSVSDSREAGVLSNMGNAYLQMGEYDQAEKMYAKTLELAQASNRPYSVAESYSNLGELNLARNKPAEALENFFRSLAIRRNIPDLEGSSMCLYFIGRAYTAQRQYDLARQYLQQGIETSVQVSARKWLTNIYEALKDLEVAQGNYPQALDYFEQFSARKDSLFDEEKSRQMAEMQTRFETLQKEQKLQLQQKELEVLQQQARMQAFLRNGLIGGLISLLLLGYLVVSRQRLKIRQNRELLAKNREIAHSQQALARVELENAHLQEIKLKQELEFKNKELASYAINFIQKNELMEELKANIQQLKKSQDKNTETARKLSDLSRMVDSSVHIDKEWEDFKRHFEEVHKDFFKILKEHYPDLTPNELKLCTLLKLNMNLKEAANIMGISPESVKTARYRLRKKFNLTRDENLIDHILELEKRVAGNQYSGLNSGPRDTSGLQISLN
jgi:tetratricopeptide (TPR) repeat protein/DNA-binding CsgD family transcriptional regulator